MPDKPPDLRPPTREELVAIQSGAGMLRWGGGPPHSESTWSQMPWMLRGLYPDPGEAHRIISRNPIVGPAVRLVEDHVTNLNWRLVPPRLPTTGGDLVENELGQLAVLNWVFDQLNGGFPRYLRGILRSMPYGFSLAETVWSYLDQDLTLPYLIPQPDGATPVRATVTVPAGFGYPSRVRWLNSWTVQNWVLDSGYPGASGDVTGILQRSEKGLVHIVREKLQHFARGFYSDNPEGSSTLRPIWWVEKAMSDEFVSDRITRERHGEGTVVAEWVGSITDQDMKPDQYGNIEDVISEFISGQNGYMVVLPGWKISLDFGGSANNDPIPRLQHYEQLMGKALGDVVRDLGSNKFGSKAGMEVVAGEGQKQLSGICHDYCVCAGEEMLRPIARMNGWDVSRAPRLATSGFIDAADVTAAFNFANAGLLGNRPEDEDMWRRLLGVES